VSKKRIFYFLLSLLISVALIWLLLSKIEAKDILRTFLNIHVPALLIFFTLSLAGSFLRAWRYKVLLSPRKISWGNILLVTFIRNLFADLLPLRIGSLSYVYVLNARLKYSVNAAASSFVVSLVYDFLSLSPFLALAILVLGLGNNPLSTPLLLLLSVVFFLFLLALIWKLPEFCRMLLKVYQFALKTTGKDQRKWAQLSIHKIQATITDIRALKQQKTDWPAFLLSLGIRSAKYGALFFLLFALLHSHGYTMADLSLWKTILGITGAELTGYFPLKGLGGFGTWESGWAIALVLLGFESRIAIISSGIHLVTNLWEYLFGVASIVVLALPERRKRKKSQPPHGLDEDEV
jgi:uncharacterized membrane protein YbhN (UPF0104 family)